MATVAGWPCAGCCPALPLPALQPPPNRCCNLLCCCQPRLTLPAPPNLLAPTPPCPPPLCRFLQPGLLLKGVNLLYDDSNIPAGQPRKSWIMRAWQQREAVAEGLAEWQANPYFAAGRVTVPALLDTFACQSFFNEVCVCGRGGGGGGV